MDTEEWQWCMYFITAGGKIGKRYEEFHKVIQDEEANGSSKTVVLHCSQAQYRCHCR
jgi:hypothetical protein